MPRRTLPVIVLAAGALLVGCLAGCGTATDGQQGPEFGASATSPAGTPTRTEPGVLPTRITPTVPATTARPPATTVRGTLSRDSVEGSCLVLTTSPGGADAGRRYLLMGDSETLHDLTDGDIVTVSGHRETGLATTCQSGTPFLVEAVLASP